MNIDLINFKDLIHETMRELDKCREELEDMPAGYLGFSDRRKSKQKKSYYIHYYWEKNVLRQVTIPNGDPLIGILARKRYLKKKISLLENNLTLLNRIGNDYINPSFSTIVDSLSRVYSDLPPEYFNNKYSIEALAWMNEPYEKDMTFARYNLIPTSLGFKVKSKGERDIIERMVNYAVPLHHEEIMYIDYHKIAPDITFRRPSNGEIGYWEHLGRMFDPKYRKNFIWKIQQLEKIGIYPGKNLILTFEGEGQFLSIAEIDEIIKSKIL